jgi:uncharacterized membrane protein
VAVYKVDANVGGNSCFFWFQNIFLSAAPIHPFGATHTALNFPSMSGAFGIWALMLVTALMSFAAELLFMKCKSKLESTGQDDEVKAESMPHLLHIEGTVDEHNLEDFYKMLHIYMNVKVIRGVDNE